MHLDSYYSSWFVLAAEGTPVIQHSSMHLSYAARGHRRSLKAGENVVHVAFESPLNSLAGEEVGM